MFHFPLWGWVWLAKSLKRPFTQSRGYPQQFVGNFVGKDIPMTLTHNTLMTLPLNKMIADTQACRSVWHWLLQIDENIGGETRETPKTRMKWKNHLIEKKIITCRSCRVSIRVSVPTGKRGRVTCPKCGEKNAIV